MVSLFSILAISIDSEAKTYTEIKLVVIVVPNLMMGVIPALSIKS